MSAGDDSSPFWIHVLTMVPLPFMGLMALRGSVVAFGGGHALLPGTPSETALAAVGFVVPLVFAVLTWAPVRSLRGLGYLGYSLGLSIAFAIGAVLAVMSLSPGHGLGFDGLTWTLLIGSFLSGASLLPLAHLIVTDWRSSRRASDVGRP
jgi:hypothetical protein